MKFFPRKAQTEVDTTISSKVFRRLRTTNSYELSRWIDQTVNGILVNLKEIQKSLSRSNGEEALVYIEDARKGALAL
jgi:hypothetical protein